MDVHPVETASDLEVVRTLFREYQQSLGIDLSFQAFEQEWKSLPGAYAPPSGRIYLARSDFEIYGCVAFRPLSGDTCEMKRLYVRPGNRGAGIGRVLVERVLWEAREIGYTSVVLDTLPWMRQAIGLYESLGFREVAPFRYNPVPGTRYLERSLCGDDWRPAAPRRPFHSLTTGGKRVDPKRELLRHTVATLAYRGGKAVRGASTSFGLFRASETTRTPVSILAHVGDLLDWALSMARGERAWHDSEPLPWDAEVERFFAALAALDAFLASDDALLGPTEGIFQGPIADALSHVGQIAMLRRMAGEPIRGENYFVAGIEAGRVGPDQAEPRSEFE
jgi:GNAT superfamily N-acetyltransferase